MCQNPVQELLQALLPGCRARASRGVDGAVKGELKPLPGQQLSDLLCRRLPPSCSLPLSQSRAQGCSNAAPWALLRSVSPQAAGGMLSAGAALLSAFLGRTPHQGPALPLGSQHSCTPRSCSFFGGAAPSPSHWRGSVASCRKQTPLFPCEWSPSSRCIPSIGILSPHDIGELSPLSLLVLSGLFL